MNNIIQVLNECSEEPIKTPNSIQSFGCSIIFNKDRIIEHISNNITSIFYNLTQDEIGESITKYLNIDISNLDNYSKASFQIFKSNSNQQRFYGYIVKLGELYGVEIYNEQSDYIKNTNTSLELVSSSKTLEDFCSVVATYIFESTLYDRVMIYKFDDNYNGSVIGEAKKSDMESYMEHYFPADDIPSQARALYLQNLIRIIPDATYTPVRFYPEPKKLLDMTHSTLRSVSPIHCQYLANMAVQSSMSLSLVVNGTLWGLIACHSRNKHNIHPLLRHSLTTDLFHINNLLEKKVNEQEEIERKNLDEKFLNFKALISNENSNPNDILQNLQNLINSNGVVVISNETMKIYGNIPNDSNINKILRLCENKDFFASSTLSAYIHDISKDAMGIIFIAINNSEKIIFFRTEMVQTLLWAGKPEKVIKQHKESAYISPRESFETFKKREEGKSIPWTLNELNIARNLKNEIQQIIKQIKK